MKPTTILMVNVKKESGTVQFSVLKTGSLQEIYEKHKENKNEVFIIQVLPKFTSGHSLKAIKEKCTTYTMMKIL